MSLSRSAYMEWAKTRAAARYDLAGSNLETCTLDDLPEAREAVDIAGESPDGFPPLVAAIAAHYGTVPDRIATASGCSGANFLAMAAILETGDDVLVESPGYDPLAAAAQMLGATVRTFERRFEERYAVDAGRVAAAMGPATRLVVVTNPHNPSGALVSEGEMRDLEAMAERSDVLVLVDEVYRDTIFQERPAPAADRSDRFVSTSSLTKAYGLASLRCGWTLASPELTRKIRRARDVVDVWSPVPADRLSVLAFARIASLSARARRIVGRNSRLVQNFLAGRPDLECVPSSSTVAFPRIRGVADSSAFVDRLFATTGTAVVPGRFFDSPSHVRLSFGGPTDRLEKGLAAIASCLDGERARRRGC